MTKVSNMSNPLKLRPARLNLKKKPSIGRDSWSVVGYSTADRYNLLSLSEKLSAQGLYYQVQLTDDVEGNCICVKSSYEENEELNPISVKEIFFFDDGSTVFWNVPHLERENVLHFLRDTSDEIEVEPFDRETIEEESEMIIYGPSDTSNSHLTKGVIKISAEEPEEVRILEKYTFSNAIATSVKLGMLEAKLDRLIDSIDFVTSDLRRGKIHMTQAEALQKNGEIFSLRIQINLTLDLLATPDFYWDREKLEQLYNTTCAHLAIKKRTSVMNEKLSHIGELMELLCNNLNDKHHVRLEWYIILLIIVEVIFEFLHFIR